MRTNEVLIVVRRGEEYLVVHRSPDNHPCWHVISGGVEDGETDEAAAVRELREETGLEASVEALGRSFMHDGIHVEAFVCEAPAGWEPVLDWEHDDYRWVSREGAVELLYWPEPREIVGTLT
jgi:8-oxo-dGTP diphosphatase